ncbi:MAG: hypothetical protein CVU41_06145 [Chloroflexi bacterium HGW-Chloroflexi-3]|nr:MAG: hypothetical protein CVU41_06145 [Chloroflexi bacterium HGW-Chloroflexi-3]
MSITASIEIGDIYRIPNPKYPEEHFHIVILFAKDSSNLILCVPLNSYEKLDKRLQDPSCLLEPKDIPELLTKRTQVTFKKSMLIEKVILTQYILSGKTKCRAKASPEIVEKIQYKLQKSRKTPFEILDFYLQNKLI